MFVRCATTIATVVFPFLLSSIKELLFGTLSQSWFKCVPSPVHPTHLRWISIILRPCHYQKELFPLGQWSTSSVRYNLMALIDMIGEVGRLHKSNVDRFRVLVLRCIFLICTRVCLSAVLMDLQQISRVHFYSMLDLMMEGLLSLPPVPTANEEQEASDQSLKSPLRKSSYPIPPY